MVRLFRLELEHYEKIEGVRLSLDGKANRLAAMIRGNLGMAMQGLAVVPLFAGVDVPASAPTATSRRSDAPDPGGSSPTTSPAAATRSTTTTPSDPGRCSPGRR